MTTRKTLALACLAAGLVQADTVQDWNAIMVSTVAPQNPFAQARFAAIAQLAVFEAVNSITGQYRPYLGTVAAAPGASVDAAAASAAHAVLKQYFPAAAATLDAALVQSLASITDGPAKAAGIAAGHAAAAVITFRRSNDGSAPPAFYLPATTNPGDWALTAACTAAGGVLFHWRNLKPFGIGSASEFRSDPPPALTSERYVRDFNAVKRVGASAGQDRPRDRSDVARFFAAVSAVGAWNPAASQIATERKSTLSENARMFALLNMAISDGLVASMETKYHYNFWRPETAVRLADLDGNSKTDRDAAFAPFIPTPCFPSYPSAHASASYAAREVLERIFGGGRIAVKLSAAALPGIVLEYTRIKQLTSDIDDARVYGGIHFRFDQEAGADQGRDVGASVFRNRLGPTSQVCLE